MIAAHALRAKKRAMQKARVIIQISCIYMWWNGNNDIWNSMSSNWMKGFIYLRVSTWQFRPQLNLMDQFAIRLILFWLLHQGFIFLATQLNKTPDNRHIKACHMGGNSIDMWKLQAVDSLIWNNLGDWLKTEISSWYFNLIGPCMKPFQD
jgi:hypothetical protein